MLATVGVTMTVDAYGRSPTTPAASRDGRARPEVRKITDNLDALGNTTAAMGKGFAIGSAALTALALYAAYAASAKVTSIDLTDPLVVIGTFVGGFIPFLIAAMTMTSVGKAAGAMVDEIRRQFREIPPARRQARRQARLADLRRHLHQGRPQGDDRPRVIAVAAPLVIGFGLGKEALGALWRAPPSPACSWRCSWRMPAAPGTTPRSTSRRVNWPARRRAARPQGRGGRDTVGDPFKIPPARR